MGNLMKSGTSYSGTGTGVLMLNGINYTGSGNVPPTLQSDMDSVLNKKLGTSTSYPSTAWAKEVNLMGLLPEKTVSGAVASFADGADDVPIKTATFDIAPTLDGVSEVNVVRTGKNLFDGSKVTTTHTNNWGITWENGSLTIQHKNSYTSGTPVYNLNLPNGTYIFSFVGDNNYTALNKDGSYNKMLNNGTSFDIEEGHTYSITISAPANDSKTFSNIQLEIGSSATAYTAYTTPTTRTISLGQTVYGGSVTVDEDGKCELEKTYNEIMLGSNDLNWSRSNNGGSWNNYLFFVKIDDIGTSIICDDYTVQYDGSISTLPDKTITVRSNQYVYIRDDSLTSVPDFRTANGNVPFGYSLATPTTSTLTPITPITSALGVNNIWCDTGDVEVVYRADIALALNS